MCSVTMVFPILEELPRVFMKQDGKILSCDFFSINVAKVIQSGSFSQVYEGYFNSVPAAIKVIQVFSMNTLSRKRSLEREIKHLRETAGDSHIVTMYGAYADNQCYYLVFERLQQDLQELGKLPMDEVEAKRFIKEIVLGVKQMHTRGIVHRDLKIENILISKDKSVIKICDLGFARKPGKSRLFNFCGSQETVAPEILAGKGYKFGVDIWALGCIMFILLTSSSPFFNDYLTTDQIYTNMKKRDIKPFLEPHLSSDGIDLICKMLTFDEDKRIDIDGVLVHSWLN